MVVVMWAAAALAGTEGGRAVFTAGLGIPSAALCAGVGGVMGTFVTVMPPGRPPSKVQGFAVGAPIGAVLCGVGGATAGHTIGTARGAGRVAVATLLAGSLGLVVSSSTWSLPDDGIRPPTSTVAFNLGLGWSILGAPLAGAVTSQVAGRPVQVGAMLEGGTTGIRLAGSF